MCGGVVQFGRDQGGVPVNRDLELYRLARAKGRRIQDMTSAEVSALAADAMTLREKVGAAAAIAGTVYRTQVEGRRVALSVFDARRQGCGSNVCGRFGVTSDGRPVCGACGCSGWLLEQKWWDPAQACPLPEPLWVAHPAP